jgi:hypothetical protein
MARGDRNCLLRDAVSDKAQVARWTAQPSHG